MRKLRRQQPTSRNYARKAEELKRNAQIFTPAPKKTPHRHSVRRSSASHVPGTARRNTDVLEAGSPQFYASAYTKNWTDRRVRQWYAEKRKIIQKRIKRIQESAEYMHSAELQNIVEAGSQFLAARETSTKEMRQKLLPMAAFIANKHSTISGYRKTMKNAAATLQSHGINVEAKDLKNFGNFMTLAKLKNPAVSGSAEISGKVAYGFTLMRRVNLSVSTINKKFRSYMNNIEKIDAMIESGASREEVSKFVEHLPNDEKQNRKKTKMKRAK